MKRHLRRLFCFHLVLFVSLVTAFGQHLADPEFDTKVERPAYVKNTPRVSFDEAHNNFHTTSGRYKPFADLLTNDGYRIVVNRQPFTKKTLDTFKILVIVNALGEDIDEADADKPAFTEEETAALRDWVRGGGSLLLVADERPFGQSAAGLAKEFGVEMSGNLTQDESNCAGEFQASFIVYSRENHLLQDHPIVQGRDNNEKINRVMVFTGQSLKGPQGSVAFLKLADSAMQILPGDAVPPKKISASGFAQGIALKFGGGRVVVLAEADMLSALLGNPPDNDPIGMNYPDIDNKQLTLNIMHWLSGLLK
jgi:hypothetical protein